MAVAAVEPLPLLLQLILPRLAHRHGRHCQPLDMVPVPLQDGVPLRVVSGPDIALRHRSDFPQRVPPTCAAAVDSASTTAWPPPPQCLLDVVHILLQGGVLLRVVPGPDDAAHVRGAHDRHHRTHPRQRLVLAVALR